VWVRKLTVAKQEQTGTASERSGKKLHKEEQQKTATFHNVRPTEREESFGKTEKRERRSQTPGTSVVGVD